MRAVLLDCLGTLVHLEPPGPRLRAELRRAGIEVGEEAAAAAVAAEIAHYRAHHLEGHDLPGLERLRDGCAEVIAAELGLEAAALPAVRAAMLASLRFEPFPDAAPALRELRKAELRLVVASDWDCSLASALERAGLASLLDGFVSSAEVGASKPAEEVFRAALAVAGCEAGEALFVGDSPTRDVAGARAAGIRAVLLARDAASREAAGPAADAIASLVEVRSLI